MSDPVVNIPGNGRPILRLTIDLDPATRTVSVQSSIGDPVLVLGMLEQAKVIFIETIHKQQDNRIVAPPPGLHV